MWNWPNYPKFVTQVSMLQYTCMYIFVNDDLPAPLLETFVYHRDVHTHATRHQNDTKPPKETLIYWQGAL